MAVNSDETCEIEMTYGRGSRFTATIAADRLVPASPPLWPQADLESELQRVLGKPLDFPPLLEAVIPDDQIVIAIDPETPELPVLIAGVWSVLAERGVKPDNVLLLMPAGDVSLDPRAKLPEAVRERVRWTAYTPPDSVDDCAYLASTAGGERIYLARELVHADVVLSVGMVCFDGLIGFRGTNSAFYPALSSSDAVARSRGVSHQELRPADERPLRRTMDEIGWLLGTQFTLQTVPARGNRVGELIAGATESVQRRGREVNERHWQVLLDYRVDVVVISVDRSANSTGWDAFGAALGTARKLVSQDGHVIVMAEMDSELTDGIASISRFSEPAECLPALREAAPDDLVAATQIAALADWAHVYLFSNLHPDLTESLFLTPVESEDEIHRLLEIGDRVLVLPSAQFVHGSVGEGVEG